MTDELKFNRIRKMKFIILVSRKTGADMTQAAALQQEEVRVIWGMHKAGFVRSMNLRADQPGMVAEVEAADIEEVKRQMLTLPMEKAGLMDYQIIPLTPFTGYELLWKEPAR
jgi:hypothetical protein